MPFDFPRYVFNLDSSFKESGAQSLRQFLSHHITVDRWIIASDYNTGTEGTEHDVYAFAAYPISSGGIEAVRAALRDCFPRDFKHTSLITREQKRFFETRTCFAFVFTVSKSDSFLRSGNRQSDLAEFRESLSQTILHLTDAGEAEDRIRHLRILQHEAGKRDFSLGLIERILILALLNAYVTDKITSNTPVDKIWWVTDNESLTRYCHEIFNTLTFINYRALWSEKSGRNPMPQVGWTDLKGMGEGISKLVDDLIRIPDFFAAVLSRWRIEQNTLQPPPGTKRPAVRRYFLIMKHWLNENENLWLGRCRPKHNGDLQTGRILTARSRKRLERYKKRVVSS